MKIKQWITTIGEIGFKPDDSEEEKIKKYSLSLMSLPFALAGILWGILYFLFDLIIPALIPFLYGVLSLCTYFYFAVTKRYQFFRNSQLFLILILPFLLQLSLGGFVPSSAVILWAFISPVGALVFFKSKNTLLWFFSYLFLLFIAWLVNDHLHVWIPVKTTENFINTVFLLNLAAVSSLIFAVQYTYVGKQNELKKAIEQRNEKLKEMDQLKTRFFANISHEFRTPLTVILGLAEKQIESAKGAQNEKDSRTIKNNANRLLELINQLLDISKLESGEARLELHQDDLVACMKRNYSIFESIASSNKQFLLFNGKKFSDGSTDDPIVLFYDQEKIQKIITNLLSNAIKFTPAGGIIDVVVRVVQDELHVSVSNTGEPIDAAALPHLFDRFYQVNSESTREHEGTGIGLALVKELVEIHQGTIEVQSGHGKTVFTFKIPLDYDSEFKKGSSNKEVEPPLVIAPTRLAANTNSDTFAEPDELLVLIVEDNPDLRQLIKAILEKDFVTVEAADGLSGLDMATELIPDLIVSDVMMPKMDGLQLCNELKSQQKTSHIPVVLLTAKASLDNKLEGLSQGADDYLIKPFEKAELLLRIKNLIQIRHNLQKQLKDNIWSRPMQQEKANLNDQFLHGVKACTEKNLDNNLFGVEDLAKELGMSRSQVHRKLKALTNKSATTYIRNYRLYRSVELLEKTTDTISEIAYQVGFSSQTYYSSSFQDLFSKSPSEFRSNNG